MKIFDFHFLIDLHVLGYSKHKFTTSGKYLCVCMCLSMCVWQFCGKCSLRTNQKNFTKFHVLSIPNANWCLSTFGENHWTGSTVVRFFSGIVVICWSWFQDNEIAQKIIYKNYIKRNNNDVIRVLLYRTVKSFECYIFTLKYEMNIIFASIAC